MDCDHPEYIKDSTSPSSNRGFQNRIFTNPLIKGQVLLENHLALSSVAAELPKVRLRNSQTPWS